MSECRCGACMEECLDCQDEVCGECLTWCHKCGRGPLCTACIRTFNKYCHPCDEEDE